MWVGYINIVGNSSRAGEIGSADKNTHDVVREKEKVNTRRKLKGVRNGIDTTLRLLDCCWITILSVAEMTDSLTCPSTMSTDTIGSLSCRPLVP